MDEPSIVVANGVRKRRLPFPFGLCAGRREMTAIRDAIDVWLADPGNGLGRSYGWVQVDAPQTGDPFGPHNSEPELWDR